MNVTISAESADSEGKRLLTGIWLDSTNVLGSLNATEDGHFNDLFSKNELMYVELRSYLSRRLVVPLALLEIDVPGPYSATTKWVFPSIPHHP